VKSIKPGRGPSMMGGVMSVAVGVFGLIWTAIAVSIGGGLFALFGIVFIIVAIVQAVFHFKNATSQNRYSAFDITDGDEEPDPLNERFGNRPERQEGSRVVHSGPETVFCPYCGTKAEADHVYCRRCGEQLP